jgi:hypothetical protein
LDWGQIEVRALDGSGALLAQASTDANGEYRLWGLPLAPLTLQYRAPEWIMLEEAAQRVETTAGMVMPTTPRARHTTAMTGAWIALHTPWLADSVIP